MNKQTAQGIIRMVNEDLEMFKDKPDIQTQELAILCEAVSTSCLLIDKLMDPYNGKNFGVKKEVLERILLGEKPEDIEREKLIQALDGTDPWDPNICW